MFLYITASLSSKSRVSVIISFSSRNKGIILLSSFLYVLIHSNTVILFDVFKKEAKYSFITFSFKKSSFCI